uniref:WGS project CAEQ00000000 data, annotated contig 1731 n=1 Tax=Trypanosoma congolense (strain IL3000) TaxID=1068625 RepID=F9W8E8_TRYCI|nr:unnamed protein product [Trypanosoma congolense IL3000]
MDSFSDPINLNSLLEVTQIELSSLLGSLEPADGAAKVLYASPTIFSTLNAICDLDASFLSGIGVSGVFPFSVEDTPAVANHAIFLVSSDVDLLRMFATTLISYAEKNPDSSLHVFFVPKKTLVIEHLLENEYQELLSTPKLHIGEFEWDAFPLDEDVVSMQLPHAFRRLAGDGDMTIPYLCARMLLKLQSSLFGSIPLIRGKGAHASKVVQILKQMRSEVGSAHLMGIAPKIDSLLVIDRSLDLLTPLLTQMTYEGIIDEFFSIDCGCLALPCNIGEGSNVNAGDRIVLSNKDKMFKEIRNKNFAYIGGALHNKSILIKQNYEKRKELQQLRELKDFMKELPEMQEMHRLIGVHTSIATEIRKKAQTIDFRRRIAIEQYIVQQINEREVLDYIEELIIESAPIAEVLRLLSMYSIVNGGLKAKTYDSLKQLMMLSYDIPLIMATLMCLDRCGLISKYNAKRSNYTSLRKQFKLWVTDPQDRQPNDIGSAYGGYIPLSVRVLEEMIMHPELWGKPGSLVETLPEGKAEASYEGETPEGPPVTMIFFVGGITHAEMNCIRMLQAKLDGADQARRIVVASTDMVNGVSIISSAMPYSV